MSLAMRTRIAAPARKRTGDLRRMRTEVPLAAGVRLWQHAVLMLFATMIAWMPFATAAQDELLEPEKAFRISTRAAESGAVEVRFQIADGYYMYRDRFKFETESGQMLADVDLPPGVRKRDPFFGETETYRREVQIRVPVTAEDAARGRLNLKVTSHGCSDSGVCYVPLEQFVNVRLAGSASSESVSSVLSQAASWIENLPRAFQSRIEARGRSNMKIGGLLAALAIFFALGLAAGLSRAFVSNPAAHAASRGLSLERVSSRFLAYTVSGTVVGIAGPAILDRMSGDLASTVVALTFASLAVGALLIPRAATKVATAGALLAVAMWGNALLGAAGLGLLSLAISLGLSLVAPRHALAASRWSSLLLGLSAGALALWAASPLLTEQLHDFAWAALLIVSGIHVSALDRLPDTASADQRLVKGIGFVALTAGIVMLTFAMGGRSLFSPTIGPRSSPVAAAAHFERVANIAAFEMRLRGAAKPTMLDFYADWCVSCKEMERFTFSDPAVRDRLLKMQLLQVDVTRNTTSDKEFLRRFSLFGPPAILFFDASGEELRALRVIGYQPAEKFAKVLDSVLDRQASAVSRGENR
jgi:thiol:disulfide interchange protein DsbD